MERADKAVLVLSRSAFPDRARMAVSVQEVLSAAGRDDVLLFIHGYNVEFDEAAQRTAQLAYDLDFAGAPILYSWASRGGLKDYPADEATVEWTVPHFREFLEFVMTEFKAKDVHVIAHSMGNRALVRALSEFDVGALPEGSARLRQVVLAAPDIDLGVFRQLARSFDGKADRITLYASTKDKAIETSKDIHRAPRAGGAAAVVEGVDTIDATDVKTDFLAHGYFGSSILPDLKALIHDRTAPGEANRKDLRPKDWTGGGVYWKLLKMTQ